SSLFQLAIEDEQLYKDARKFCVVVAILVVALGLLVFAGDQAINAIFTLSVVGPYYAYTVPIAARFLGDNNFKHGPFDWVLW
ncbi:hypothetical protein CVT25_003962, partial [Psilocybe cyanescens]